MKKFSFIFFLLICSFQNAVLAQQHLVDSLLAQLKQPLPDTSRALSMMRLAIDYEVVDTAKAFQAYRNAIKFAKSKGLHYFLGRIYQNQAFLLKVGGKYDRAVSSLDSAIQLYRMVNTFRARKFEAGAIADKAGNYNELNETDLAVKYYLQSVSLYDSIGQPDYVVLNYCNMASIYSNLGEYDKQLQYATHALGAAKRARLNVRLQAAYFSVAHAYSSLDKVEIAKTYLDSVVVSFDAYSNADFMISYYLIAGQIYKKLGQLDSAFYFFEKTLEVSDKFSYAFGKAESKVQMGAIAFLQKKYPEAERYLKQGISEAEAINVSAILDDAYRFLSDVYVATGRYKEAFEYYEKYKDVSDTILSVESRSKIAELEKKYETEKKDAQLKLQEAQLMQKDIINYILIGGSVTLAIILLLSYRTYSQKRRLQQQRINELETEKQLTATEAVLKGEEKERTRLAKDLHDGLGGMLSGIKYSLNTMKGNLIMTPDNAQAFERSMDMLDSSIREMRRVAHNMMPEALVKFGLDTALRDYCHDINQSGVIRLNYQSIGLENVSIEQTTAITIYRVMQELVTNAVKHAGAQSVIVQVTKTDGLLSVTIEDDGKGFDTQILRQSTGMGWSNIQNRIEFLKGKLDVNSQPGKGTSVLIELNV